MSSHTTQPPEELVDIRTVKVRTDLPLKERMLDFKQQIKDPRHFRCGKYTVSLGFDPSGRSAQEIIGDLTRSKA